MDDDWQYHHIAFSESDSQLQATQQSESEPSDANEDNLMDECTSPSNLEITSSNEHIRVSELRNDRAKDCQLMLQPGLSDDQKHSYPCICWTLHLHISKIDIVSKVACFD